MNETIRMKSLSFDGLVELYDETRVFDLDCFDAALGFLMDRFSLQDFNKLLEPGIGTGRIAIPLAERGYHVTGVDVSEEMLALLEKRLMQSSQSLPISLFKADVTDLPFANAAFDIAVAVHLFYFVREWKKAAEEILRVVKCDGPIVLMHTGTGAEIPLLNQRYKELCAQQGCLAREIGVRSTREVVGYFEGIGYRVEWIRDRWQWTSRIRLDKALNYMKARAYSFTTFAPDDVHLLAIERLGSELRHRYGSLGTEVEVSNQIYLAIISRS